MFTTVHLHLLLNHVPIIVSGLALLFLALAAWRRHDYLARTGLALLVGAAISGLPTYLTGEGAEEAVDGLPGVTEILIEQHKDMALIAAIVLGVPGTLAALSLWRYGLPAAIPRRVVGVALTGAVVANALMAYTGLLGGRIRHTEVRPGYERPVHSSRSSMLPARTPSAEDGRRLHE